MKDFLAMFAFATFAVVCEGFYLVPQDRATPLEETVSQQAQTISQLQAKVASLETELDTRVAALETRIAAQERSVAFNVRLSATDSQPFTGQDKLVLDVVDLNLGRAYDPETGIFTAPVAGLYIFNLHISHTPPGSLHVQIMNNDHITAEVEASGDDGQPDRSSNAVVLHLNVGDRVYVKRADGTATQIEGQYRTSFTGMLVVADQH